MLGQQKRVAGYTHRSEKYIEVSKKSKYPDESAAIYILRFSIFIYIYISRL